MHFVFALAIVLSFSVHASPMKFELAEFSSVDNLKSMELDESGA